MRQLNQQSDVSTIVQRLVREGTLIVYFVLAIFLLIALSTYSVSDPGFTTTGTGDDINNAVGSVGAWLADVLFQLLGYLAYVFPAFLGYKVYSSFQETKLEEEFSWQMFALKATGFLLLTIAACGLATLHFEISDQLPYMAGGVVGSLVVELTLPILASLGSTLLFLAMFLFGLTVAVAISWLQFIDSIGAWTLAMASLSAIKLRKLIETKKQEMLAKKRLEGRKRVLDISKKRKSGFHRR
jgi:S-DNA-T family DNA segregation ATPase FtsK/SpoIIIE